MGGGGSERRAGLEPQDNLNYCGGNGEVFIQGSQREVSERGEEGERGQGESVCYTFKRGCGLLQRGESQGYPMK